ELAEREQAEQALSRHNRELALLNRASQAFSSTLDLDQVLAIVLEETRRLLDATACSVWLIEPETEELVCRHSMGPRSDVVLGWRLAPGEGVAGWVARSGESLLVPDTRVDERYFTGVDQKTGLSLRSILSVPLHAEQKVIGVLQVMDTKVGSFGAADVTLIEPLTASASIAIENARLHRKVLEHAGQLEQWVQERTIQLQSQYARLKAILRSTTDGIIVASTQGDLVLVNRVARTWLNQTLSTEDAAQLLETARDLARRASERPESVLELTGLDLELKAAPVEGEAETKEPVVVVVVHDVTHLKALDRVKTRFVSNVSHELRTPITAIKLYAYLIQQHPEKQEQYLDTLILEVDRQARLVEDILQVSRIDTGCLEIKPRPTSLNELVEMTIVNRRALAESKGLALGRQFAEPGPMALIDPKRVTQVLNNLVENAIHYTPEGGEITVSTGTREAEGRIWATATVVDTGMGISEEEASHIFERFFRGEEPQTMQISGTGLGLAIVKEIVELHGGRVTVESEMDVGSTFTVWLPLAGQVDDQP
ncbi:MAG: ATP-binding protein, partial [Chloroflexota bacterium]|nr:ATP-binding protein [Chloroflexota bacterium]